jgi:NitT/TauT family transport system ATP-binding protein
MVFQQDTVFPWMHVRANVEFAMKVKGMPKNERRESSNRWLKEVGLESFAASWPRELSGGMRKRVALAAVLAAGAEVWLMDEPFGSLDYFTRRGLHDVLLELWAESRKTVFFVTHDLEEALILADRIIVVSEGCIVEDIEVMLPRPRHEEIRASAEAVEITRTILRRLGLETGGPVKRTGMLERTGTGA